MNGTHDKYDTQELLSMNMDRLREYMEKFESLGARLEEPRASSSHSSQRLRAVSPSRSGAARPQVLLLRPDPIHLSRILRENDRLLPGERFQMRWANDLRTSVTKMLAQSFDGVVVFPSPETLPASNQTITALDFLLLLGGLMSRDDGDFLLKKRHFIAECFPAETSDGKVAQFRLLKETYRKRPVLFLDSRQDSRTSATAARIHGVHVLDLDEKASGALFARLHALLDPEKAG